MSKLFPSCQYFVWALLFCTALTLQTWNSPELHRFLLESFMMTSQSLRMLDTLLTLTLRLRMCHRYLARHLQAHKGKPTDIGRMPKRSIMNVPKAMLNMNILGCPSCFSSMNDCPMKTVCLCISVKYNGFKRHWFKMDSPSWGWKRQCIPAFSMLTLHSAGQVLSKKAGFIERLHHGVGLHHDPIWSVALCPALAQIKWEGCVWSPDVSISHCISINNPKIPEFNDALRIFSCHIHMHKRGTQPNAPSLTYPHY